MFDLPKVAGSLSLMDLLLKYRRKPGYRWPNGPICLVGEHKAYTIPLDDYLPLIEPVEHKLKDNDDASQRLRMMYYGEAVNSTKLFDRLLDSNPDWIHAPLTLTEAPQDLLDALMRYGQVDVSTSAGPPRIPIDIGHVWLMFDYVYNGVSWKGLGVRSFSPTEAVISWSGDLASWWIEFNDERQRARAAAGAAWSEPVATLTDLSQPLAWLNAGRLRRCSADDLLSDMDAVVLGVEIDKREPKDPTSAGPTPFAGLLKEYYGLRSHGMPTGRKDFHNDNRFHLFVRRAKPEIPHDYNSVTGEVTLKSTAQAVIRKVIFDTAELFLTYTRGIRRRTSVIADLDSPWGRAMLDQIAKEFTDFLAGGLSAADGWSLSGWPTLPKSLDEYGGSPLHLGSSDGVPNGPVHRLQTRLKEMGFTGVGASDGAYGPKTAMALREFQIAATYDRIYVRSLGPVNNYIVDDAIKRYFGPIHGVLDEATADILSLWYEPKKYNPRVAFDRIFNPLSIQTGTIVDGAPVLAPGSDVWAYNDVTTADPDGAPVSNRVRFFVVDLVERYDIPPVEQYAGHTKTTTIVGRYTTYQADGGPVVDSRTPKGVWNSTKITTANLIPVPLSPVAPVIRSTYRVLRAVANVECDGHFDGVNSFDSARLEIGLYHWALQAHGVGELAAFLAFYRHHYPRDYQADFGRFGILPETLNSPWNPADWNKDGAHGQARLAGRLALYGLHNSAGDIDPYTPLPLGEIDASGAPTGILAADKYMRDYLRSWRSLHRVVMAMRLSPALQQVQWSFATLRLQTLLAKSWMAGIGDGPVVTEGATLRPARFGEVFTSEKAVAALLRWHVNRPRRVISGNVAVLDATDAFKGVYGGGQVNLTSVPAAEKDQRQRDLVQRLIDQAPAGWFRDSVNATLNYVDADAGALQDAASSFLLFVPTL